MEYVSKTNLAYVHRTFIDMYAKNRGLRRYRLLFFVIRSLLLGFIGKSVSFCDSYFPDRVHSSEQSEYLVILEIL